MSFQSGLDLFAGFWWFVMLVTLLKNTLTKETKPIGKTKRFFE